MGMYIIFWLGCSTRAQVICVCIATGETGSIIRPPPFLKKGDGLTQGYGLFAVYFELLMSTNVDTLICGNIC